MIGAKPPKVSGTNFKLTDAFASKKLKRITRDLEDLTGHLGDDHDLHLLSLELSGSADPDSLRVREELRKRRAKLQKKAFKLARKTFDLAPSVFHEQISRCLNQVKN